MHLRHEPRRSRRLPRPLLVEPLEERCLLSYSITDLGTLPGDYVVQAYGINGSGQVVGFSYYPGPGHAFRWDSSGGMQDLGSLGGQGSGATGINAAGQVVGNSHLPNGDGHAFLWDSSNGMQDLGSLEGQFSHAFGINDSGQVVGEISFADGHSHAWGSNGGDLGTLPGDTDSRALGINASGQVVGSSWGQDDSFHAFLWDSTNGMQDLGTFGGLRSEAYGINDVGQVVGYSTLPNGPRHAFLWDSSGGMQDLGTLPGAVESFARGINPSGQVVGNSLWSDGHAHAFLWDSSGGMQDLNDLLPPGSGWILGTGWAINDGGQIVGWGTNPSGQHAYLLTPDGGGAPRGRMKSPAGIDPAVIQVLASFASHDTPGLSGSVSLFQNVQAGPVSPEAGRPLQGRTTLPTRAGLIPQRASTQWQAQDVLFAAGDLTQTAGQWSGWELDLPALELSQSG